MDIPIVMIVGAGRSGTNFLARLLEQDDRFVNVYENRYIWNYRQASLLTDIRDRSDANERIINYIRNHYKRVFLQNGSRILVDKTPGNALRLDFVNKVFPQAKIINILRDGRANVISRINMWDKDTKKFGRTRNNLSQFRKMRERGNLPIERIPSVMADNLRRTLRSLIGRKPVIAGERIPGLDAIASCEGLEAARAVQWRETVMRAVISGRRLGSRAYHEIKLEDLEGNASIEYRKLFEFLDVSLSESQYEYLTGAYDAARASRWCLEADAEMMSRLEPLLRPTLEFLGYKYEISE